MEDHGREIGHETLELWVINDNERAIGVYERACWVGTEEVKAGCVLRSTRTPFPQASALGARHTTDPFAHAAIRTRFAACPSRLINSRTRQLRKLFAWRRTQAPVRQESFCCRFRPSGRKKPTVDASARETSATAQPSEVPVKGIGQSNTGRGSGALNPTRPYWTSEASPEEQRSRPREDNNQAVPRHPSRCKTRA